MADRFKVIDTPLWTFRDFAILLVFSFVMLWSHTALAQVYGLGFLSHAELKENRTQLDLNPNHFFSFHEKFMVSFSMTLRQNEPAYFGYILRIIDDENKNVDLIYTYQSAGTNTRFELVYGEESTNKSARVNFNKICAKWIEIKLAYDYQKQEFRLISPDTTILAFPVKFSPRIKILFGASDYKNFKTTDVPPMNIKDIRIFHDGKLNHEWPLNESAGNIVFDVKGSTNALATNPEWLKPRFQKWVKRFEGEFPGIAGIAFNAAEELIYLIGEEALIVYSVRDNLIDTVLYQNNPVVLKQGCQAFYDTNNNLLVSYNIDQKTISTLDPQTGIWEQMVAEAYPLTIYWHHNKFFSAADSSLYILGGYGQHEYKNSVTRYSFHQKSWEKLVTSNEVFHPRYLAALGNLNDTLFVLGGYGSLSGKQIKNPGIYNDLFTYHPGIRQVHFTP